MTGQWIATRTAKTSLDVLRTALVAGECVQVTSAYGNPDHNTIGDVVRAGFACKDYIVDAGGDVEGIAYFYFGPVPIIVDDVCVFPQTWVEVG